MEVNCMCGNHHNDDDDKTSTTTTTFTTLPVAGPVATSTATAGAGSTQVGSAPVSGGCNCGCCPRCTGSGGTSGNIATTGGTTTGNIGSVGGTANCNTNAPGGSLGQVLQELQSLVSQFKDFTTNANVGGSINRSNNGS